MWWRLARIDIRCSAAPRRSHYYAIFDAIFGPAGISGAVAVPGAVATRTAKPGRSRPAATPYRLPSRRSPAAAKADPASIEPTRAERVGIAPAQDTRMKEWRTRNARRATG